jgi:hypothetical protein
MSAKIDATKSLYDWPRTDEEPGISVRQSTPA